MMKPSSSITIDESAHKFLLIGQYGSGKSVFAASCPTPGIVFDFTNNGVMYRKGDWTVATYPITPAGWMEFEKEWRVIYDEVKTGKSKYKTVVFDDATGMDNLAMERALQMDPKRNEANGPIWNVHYALVKNLLEGKMRQLLSLPVNVVLNCHVEIVKDEKTGAIIAINPMLAGKLSTILPGYFDEVYFATTGVREGKPAWMLQTVPVGLRQSRSQLSGTEGYLPHYVKNTYTELMRLLKEGQEKGEAQGVPEIKIAAKI